MELFLKALNELNTDKSIKYVVRKHNVKDKNFPAIKKYTYSFWIIGDENKKIFEFTNTVNTTNRTDDSVTKEMDKECIKKCIEWYVE